MNEIILSEEQLEELAIKVAEKIVELMEQRKEQIEDEKARRSISHAMLDRQKSFTIS